MLKVVDFTQKRNSASGCVMLLGGFDGLHIGHKKLMETAKTYALPIGVMTILGGKAGLPLFTAEERAEIFVFEQLVDQRGRDRIPRACAVGV